MRRVFTGIVVMALGFGAAAQAQQLPNVVTPASPDSAIAVPPAPAIVAEPPGVQAVPVPVMPSPPGLVSAPPANVDSGDQTQPGDISTAQGQGPATPDAQAPDIAPIPANNWVPAQTAKIGVLDKIDGSVVELLIPVGGQSVVGDLQVSVQACMTRPPDQVPDAAVFLALQSTADTSAPPDYRGWVVRSAPGAALAGDASETFRIIDCN